MIQSVLISAVAVAGLWAAGPLLPASPLAEVAPVSAPVQAAQLPAPAPAAPAGACAPQAPAQALVAPAPAPAAALPSQAGSGPLDANTATAAQFDALPLRAITPEVAAAIVAKRTKLGGRFTSLAQLDDVKGVGPATERQLPQHVHV